MGIALNVAISVEPMPNRNPAIDHVTAPARMTPITPPIRTRRIPPPTAMATTLRADAPRDMRMPISRVRRATV